MWMLFQCPNACPPGRPGHAGLMGMKVSKTVQVFLTELLLKALRRVIAAFTKGQFIVNLKKKLCISVDAQGYFNS